MASIMTGIAVSASVGGPTWAALGAHEHGVADLTVAVEAETVDLVLTAPSGDLVGLERAPATEQERRSVRERVAALETGHWFTWDGATCDPVSVEVTLPAALTVAVADAPPGGDAHDHRDHAGHQHDRDHGSHQHDHKHDHKRDHETARDQEHMDGMVSWQYRCDAGARLRRVDVQLFDLLPLQRIRAQTISERGQGASNLTPTARRLTLP